MNKYPHCCRYCKNGTYIPLKREALCKYSGVMQSSGICGRYVFDPFKFKVRRLRNIDVSKYSREDFSIE